MSQALAPSQPQLLTPALRSSLVVIGCGLPVLALLFQADIVAAIRVWIQSTAYNHCFFVIPLAGYLIWDRRSVLYGATPRPWSAPAIVALPISLLWLGADRLGVLEGQQLLAMTLVQLLFLAALGWPLYRAVLGPLLYLYFLVPFGAFITPLLQDFTTTFVTHGLNVIGIPNYTDGFTIEIPEGKFYVAEACAGLRFLIAAVAFGSLYALLMYRSPLRRGLFILASIVVPIIANGFRALGIVSLGHVLGSAQAAATDHVLYGWVFFSIVILMLVAIGLPFREDDIPPARLPPNPPQGGTRAGRMGPALVVAASAIGPLIALGFDHAAAATVPPAPVLQVGECTRIGPDTPLPSPVAGRITEQHLDCGGGAVTVRTEVFSPRVQPGVLAREERRLAGLKEGDTVASATLNPHGVAFHLVQTDEPKRTAATAIWVGGKPSSGGRWLRFQQGWASVAGGLTPPLVMVVTADPALMERPNGYAASRAAVVAWLDRQPDLANQIQRITATR